MKKLLLISAALCLLATSAFASGIDLVVTACPGVVGSSNDAGLLDCAGGSTLVLLGVFQPAEAISDLVAADAILDFTVTGGDMHSTANFWDLESNNSAALNGAPSRPGSGCTAYTNAFGVANSGFAAAAAVQANNRTRVATTSYRPSNLNATLNQKIFGFQLLIDLSTSVEAGVGGTSTGCTLPIAFALEQIIPGSAANIPVTTLTTGATGANTNVVLANLAGQPVPAARHSWGQLKSLYR